MAKEIEKIQDVAMVLLPEDADDDVLCALAAIPMEDVASVVYAPVEANLRVLNGVAEIGDNDFGESGRDICVVNGMAIIRNLSENIRGSMYVNGIIVLHESLRNTCHLSFPCINGMMKYLDIDNCQSYGNRGELDADTLRYLAPKTLFMAGNELAVAGDVTPEMLQDKGIILMAGNRIVCHRNIAGYIRATAFAGNQIDVVDG